MTCTLVIPDVHLCCEAVEEILGAFSGRYDQVVFLGDSRTNETAKETSSVPTSRRSWRRQSLAGMCVAVSVFRALTAEFRAKRRWFRFSTPSMGSCGW